MLEHRRTHFDLDNLRHELHRSNHHFLRRPRTNHHRRVHRPRHHHRDRFSFSRRHSRQQHNDRHRDIDCLSRRALLRSYLGPRSRLLQHERNHRRSPAQRRHRRMRGRQSLSRDLLTGTQLQVPLRATPLWRLRWRDSLLPMLHEQQGVRRNPRSPVWQTRGHLGYGERL